MVVGSTAESPITTPSGRTTDTRAPSAAEALAANACAAASVVSAPAGSDVAACAAARRPSDVSVVSSCWR